MPNNRSLLFLISSGLLLVAFPLEAQENLIVNSDLTKSVGSTPAEWAFDSWGDNKATSRYLPAGAPDGTGALEVSMRRWKDGDAKWHFQPIAVSPGRIYRYSEIYKASVVTETVAEFRNAAGKRSWQSLGYDPKATTWRKSEFTFAIPDAAVDLTVLHVLKAVGTLATAGHALVVATAPSFKRGLVTIMFDDGYVSVHDAAWPVLKRYGFKTTQFIISGEIGKPAAFNHPVMTREQIDDLAKNGNEIQSHTATHPDLTKLDPAQLEAELAQSKSALEGWNRSIDTLALPYGAYNPGVVAAVKKHYAYCRTSDVGLNERYDFDRYRIRIEAASNATTLSEVKSWLAKAKQDKAWLAILYHDVGEGPGQGDEYSVPPESFKAQMKLISDSGLPVVTARQALSEIVPQLSK